MAVDPWDATDPWAQALQEQPRRVQPPGISDAESPWVQDAV